MQTFETNQPIALSIELSHGAVHVIASDRTDTVVSVNPSDRDRAGRRRGGGEDRRRPGQRNPVRSSSRSRAASPHPSSGGSGAAPST